MPRLSLIKTFVLAMGTELHLVKGAEEGSPCLGTVTLDKEG